MTHAPTGRLRRLALCSLGLGLGFGLATTGCRESTTSTHPKLRLVQPLTMTWPGKDQGQGYHGQGAAFTATTNLRANWHFELRGDKNGQFSLDQIGQDYLYFKWNSGVSTPGSPFDYGEHCVATVSFEIMELDPRDTPKAQLDFVIAP